MSYKDIHSKCKKSKAYAWAQYFKSETDKQIQLTEQYYFLINITHETKKHSDTLPIHIINEIEEKTQLLKKKIECPICMDVIDIGGLQISFCGHKYCKECFEKLDQCAICRKKFNN